MGRPFGFPDARSHARVYCFRLREDMPATPTIVTLAAISASSRTMLGGIPMLSRAIRPINRAVAIAAIMPIAADLGIKAHAHMLCHACGYKLANDGHDTRAIQAYLGHRNIQNTTRYTALAPQRFKEFFGD